MTTLGTAALRDQVTLGSPALDLGRRRRLAELGLRAGAVVTVLHRTAGGGRVVSVQSDGACLALDRETLASLPVLAGSTVHTPVAAARAPRRLRLPSFA